MARKEWRQSVAPLLHESKVKEDIARVMTRLGYIVGARKIDIILRSVCGKMQDGS